MGFRENTENIVHFFDHVDQADFVESTIGEGRAGPIAEHIGLASWTHVDADRAGVFFSAAADVEDTRSGISGHVPTFVRDFFGSRRSFLAAPDPHHRRPFACRVEDFESR